MEDYTSVNSTKVALKWAGIASIGVIIVGLIGQFFGQNQVIGCVFSCLYIILLGYTMYRSTGEQKGLQGGFLTFGQAFRNTSLVGLIFSATIALFTLVSLLISGQELLDNMKNMALEQAKVQGEEAYDMLAPIYDMMFQSTTLTITVFITMLIFSLIVALLVSLVAKRSPAA